MNMMDLTILNIYNSVTIERISVYLDKHSRLSLDSNDYFVKQISHLSKGVVIEATLSFVFGLSDTFESPAGTVYCRKEEKGTGATVKVEMGDHGSIASEGHPNNYTTQVGGQL